MNQNLALGIDVGGTKIAYVIANAQGEPVAEYRIPANFAQGQATMLDQLVEGVAAVLAKSAEPVAGIGIGVPGHVDPRSGVVRDAVNLGWSEVMLRDEVRLRLASRGITGVPIWIQKDANAAALGEMYFGAVQGCQDFIMLTVGTGLGGGCIVGGEVLLGANSYAMEIGHFARDPGGRVCKCGLHDCPEAYISGTGFLVGFREHKEKFPASLLFKLQIEISPAAILDAARANDPLAQLIVDEAAIALADVIVFGAAFVNPEVFVIGGGLGRAAAGLLIPTVRAMLPQRTLRAAHQRVKIVESQVTNSALGAACLVWHGLRDKIA